MVNKIINVNFKIKYILSIKIIFIDVLYCPVKENLKFSIIFIIFDIYLD